MFKKEIENDQNKKIDEYKSSGNIYETFKKNLNESKNIKEEIYYLQRAQEKLINEKESCLQIIGKVCKSWGVVPLSFLFANDSTICLWGIISACNTFYQQNVQELDSRVESLEKTILEMTKIIKSYHEITISKSNQNLNQMKGFAMNEIANRKNNDDELNI